jgi:hypothetical protein
VAYKYDVYIGSDNGSRRIRRDYLDKIIEWADRYCQDGYTLVRGRGYYRGAQEDSLVLSVLSDYDTDLRTHIAELKQTLDQEAIAVAKYRVELELI